MNEEIFLTEQGVMGCDLLKSLLVAKQLFPAQPCSPSFNLLLELNNRHKNILDV